MRYPDSICVLLKHRVYESIKKFIEEKIFLKVKSEKSPTKWDFFEGGIIR